MNVSSWSRSRGVRFVLCLAVSAVFFYLAVREMHFDRVLQEIKKSSPGPIVGAICFLFVSFWVRAYRWRYLLSPIRQISVYPLFRSVVIGFMGNYLLPFRAGEVMRAVSIGQTQSISKATALGSIVLERAFDGIALALTPFLLLAVVDLPGWIVQVSVASLAMLVAGLIILVVAIRRGCIEGLVTAGYGYFPEVCGRPAGCDRRGIRSWDERYQSCRRATAGFGSFAGLLAFSWHVFLSALRSARSQPLLLGRARSANGHWPRGHFTGRAWLRGELRIFYDPGSGDFWRRSRVCVCLCAYRAHLSICSGDRRGAVLRFAKRLPGRGESGRGGARVRLGLMTVRCSMFEVSNLEHPALFTVRR